MDVKKILDVAISKSASDIHITPNNPPMLRINGIITPMHTQNMDNTTILSFVKESLKNKDIYKDMDFAITHNNNRFRVNFFYSYNGPSLVLRVINNTVLTLNELGAPDAIKNITSIKQGLILATGPTGSGKSTTVNSIIDHINKNHQYHIITIEDPIEFIHKSQKSLINQREISTHTQSFSKALKAAFREDPDVIFIGEMRDLETIKLALTASETGHLVFGTLHTSSAHTTIDRIIDVFPENEKKNAISMIANSLKAVVSQRLLMKADHSGRIAAYEILIPNSAIRNLIREYKIAQIPSMMQTSKSLGNCLMEEYIENLIQQGLVEEKYSLKQNNKSSSQQITSKTTTNVSQQKSSPLTKQNISLSSSSNKDDF